jgi:carboxypeptidase family protein
VIRPWREVRTGRHGSLRPGLRSLLLPRLMLICLLHVALAIAAVRPPAVAQDKPATPSNGGSYRIVGTVINVATGEPIQRAVVSALGQDQTHSTASVVSDTQGHFAIEGLPAAKYPLSASKRGFRTALYDDHEGYNTAIVTGPDQDTTHLIFFLVPGAVLHGVVSADGGDPVEGARVMLFEKPRHPTQDERFLQLESATTDDTGAYEFGDLADGDYFVAVAAQPWYATAMHRAGGNLPGNGANDAGAQLDVAYPITYFDSTADEASAAEITLAKGGRMEANINLHAVSALHLGIPPPRDQLDKNQFHPIMLRQSIFGAQVPTDMMLTPDPTRPGGSQLIGVAPGHYELEQGNPPHITEMDATASGQIDSEAGSATVAVTGTLKMSAGGMPPEEIPVILQPQQGAESHAKQVATAQNGRFHFDSVAPGPWSVKVIGAGGEMPALAVESGGTAHGGNQVAVHDRPLDLVVTVGEGTTRVEGFARKDGKGFPGAMIVLVPKQANNLEALVRRDQSDSDGSFSLPDVVPGQYTIVAIEDGWELDWIHPGVLARYLPGGTAVTVNGSSGDIVHLAGFVAVQPR